MLKNFLLFFASFSLAGVILGVTIFRVAGATPVFSQAPSALTNQPKEIEVAYNLPYPGSIMPDSILWPLKALRDKLWLALTLNPAKKADLDLLIADKRLADAEMLFRDGKSDLAISVLTKSEKYLESAFKEERIAKSSGMDTTAFLNRFALATLKHRQVLDHILAIAPEDARPFIVKTEDYPKLLYVQAKNGLLQAGIAIPQNPFE